MNVLYAAKPFISRPRIWADMSVDLYSPAIDQLQTPRLSTNEPKMLLFLSSFKI